MQVLVLKTNIRYKKHLKEVAPLLDGKHNILRWNVDLQDRDKVLRIEAAALPVNVVIQLIQNAGFDCEELAD
jgi:copper chaperone